MTFTFNNVYVDETATVVGPYEAKGPLGKLFDKRYKDLYFNTNSLEKAEVKLLHESISILLNKTKKETKDINLIIAGDLLNQITSSSYGINGYDIPFLGIYNACATSVEGMIMASSLIDSGKINNSIVAVSSHNLSSEKQFRNPTEYGAPKPMSSTFTATGGAAILFSDKKSKIKVASGTIGKIIDYNQNDPNNMGAVMAGAAAYTINQHLKDLKRDANYYDIILTGDLGIYGKEILKEYMKEEYNISLSDNYDDCGVMLYDIGHQKEVHAGGSGPVCSALVNYSYIYDMLKKGKLKHVLLVATGALFSPTFVYQKQNILSIAHAISLEVI